MSQLIASITRTFRTLTPAVTVCLALLLAAPIAVFAQTQSAVRSFDADTVEPGVTIEITVTANDYGQIGQIVETLPEGFTFVDSTHDAEGVEVDGRAVTFTLLQDDSVTYTVMASETDGEYEFTGILKDEDRQEFAVGGASIVTVLSPATPTPEPTFTPTTTPTPAAGSDDVTPDAGDEGETDEEEQSDSLEILPWIIGAIVVLAALAGGAYLFLRRR